jgi:hypothetical protein
MTTHALNPRATAVSNLATKSKLFLSAQGQVVL